MNARRMISHPWRRGWNPLPSAAILLLMSIPVNAAPQDHQSLIPGGGEIIISPGVIEGTYLISSTARKALSNCLDLGGSLIAVPSLHDRSELFLLTEIRYGLWYCCIPDYYVDYLYFSLGGGSFSRLGLAERDNAFTLTCGSGLRLELFDRLILDTQLKVFVIPGGPGRRNRLAFLLGGGLPL